MDGLFKKGNLSAAFEVEQEMMERNLGRDVVVYNILINCLCSREVRKAKALCVEMKNTGLTPDHVTYKTIISAYCREGELNTALKLSGEMKSAGLMPNLITFSTLLEALCEAKDLDLAMDL